MAARFEALNKLRERARESYHDYRAGTEIFPSLDVERVARDLDLVEAGKRRGEENQPSSNSRGYDEVELSIIERVEDEKKRSHNTVEDELQAFAGRLARLEFDERFGLIRKANSTSVSDFKAEVAIGLDELHGRRRALNLAEQELFNFRKDHGLKRAARVQNGIWHAAKVAFLIAIFGSEVAMNASFLAKGNELGFFGGLMEATAFAAANIGLTLVLAVFCVRYVAHRSWLKKLVGTLSAAGWLAFAAALNLALAHYRGISATIFDGAGTLVVDSIRDNPLGLPDIQSWLLLVVGFLFSVGAFIDGLSLTDPYPGYAGAEKRLQEARREYLDERTERIQALQEIRDEHNEKVEEIIRNLAKDKREYSAVLEHRAKLLSLFSQHQDHLERACNQLLQRYREANIQARSDPPPERFRSPYKLERIRLKVSDGTASETKALDAAIRKAQDQLAAQVQRVGEACEEGIEQYRKLDTLFPDYVNGQAV